MNDDTTRQDKARGRTFLASVAGDTAVEIELAALDAARAFFGDGPQLEVVHDYTVIDTNCIPAFRGCGKEYTAEVPVRTVEA